MKGTGTAAPVTDGVTAATETPVVRPAGSTGVSLAATHLYFEYESGIVLALIPRGAKCAIPTRYELPFTHVWAMYHDGFTRYGQLPASLHDAVGVIQRVHDAARKRDVYVFDPHNLDAGDTYTGLMAAVVRSPALLFAVYDVPGSKARRYRSNYRCPFKILHAVPRYDATHHTRQQYWETITVGSINDVRVPADYAAREVMPVYGLLSENVCYTKSISAEDMSKALRRVAAYQNYIHASTVSASAVLTVTRRILTRVAGIEDRLKRRDCRCDCGAVAGAAGDADAAVAESV